MKHLIAIFYVALGLAQSPSVRADVKLPAIFGDHMVLQREASVPVWGWAEPGEDISVRVAGQTLATKAGADGRWTVKFSNLKSTGPTTLVVKGKNEITIKDVLIGEVWLGSGQSNMAMAVNRAKDFEQEQKAANLSEMRMFKEESAAANEAQTEGKGKWVLCTPDTVGTFSATLFFFGREIHQALGVPVGLINSSVGGTPIESWIAPEAQRASKELKAFFDATEKDNAGIATEAAVKKYESELAQWKADVKKAKAAKQKAPRAPRNPADVKARKANIGGLFNGKIAPLIPYALRGALWYQGEANSTPAKAPFYEHQLKLLVTDWRARWGHEFPFAWAQLPNFGGAGRNWPIVREAMLKTLVLPKTGMGINIDIGEEKDIHPKNKQEVGRRLSLWALGTVYGQKVPATSGPLLAEYKVQNDEIVLRFNHADLGLVPKGGIYTGYTISGGVNFPGFKSESKDIKNELKGFVIAGEDKQWKPANAHIIDYNSKDYCTRVVVSSPDVPKPVAVRYAWENFPACNLYNGAGLPASPFRTDEWK